MLLGCSSGSNNNNTPPEDTVSPLGLEVQLDSGTVRGREHPESDVWEWLAIPFAAPPVGELRWKAPRPAVAWEGVRDAVEFGNPCPQWDRVDPVVIGDEDCLQLNVWRPRSDERDLPVYVWIHGGSNTSGSNDLSVYQGDRLAQQSNMVVVAIQYRLGALGWLYYPPLHTGDPQDDSGNYGLLDIIRSLEWVRDNIAGFGGDAGNVIVTGESAGAINIMSLLLSEQAGGLFHKAIIQSGIPLSNTPEEGVAGAVTLIDNLLALEGVTETPLTGEQLAQRLRQTQAAELVMEYEGPTGAYADGSVIPSAGAELFVNGGQVNKVPVIVGTNRDEYKLWTNPLTYNALPDASDELRAAVGRYVSDLWRVVGADQFATDLTAADDQPAVYVYRFSWGSPDAEGNSPLPLGLGQTLGAHHAMEIPFVLGNWEEWVDPRGTPLLFTPDNAAGREALSAAIMQYFAAFARSGNPNGDNLPAWEAFSAGAGFKALQLDISLVDNSPRLTADTETWTVASVLADLDANVMEPLRTEVLAMLAEMGWQ